MATYHLHNWSVTQSLDPFLAPEKNTPRLSGRRAEDDREVVTGPIVKVDGRQVTTYSGSVYILEEIHPEYLEWLRDNNIPYNFDSPISLKNK